MIVPRRNADRLRVSHGKLDTWLTFPPRERRGLLTDDFGVLAGFDEVRIPPGEGKAAQASVEAEIVTYMLDGSLAHEDSTGVSGVIHAGEFQRMSTGRGIRRREKNASRTRWAHLFQITLNPSEAGLERTHEQKLFPAAQRRNLLCVVASPDGRRGSLRVFQDACIYSCLLDPGHHIIHEMTPGRSAWLHVVRGEVKLVDVVLTEGDGAGVTEESSISFTARESSEILIVDVGPASRLFGSLFVT